ncbi:MAG TPA: hypothetical protein VE961_00065 [Pyrinomonadaceae bacterium]|nr:hypothetical protein [Pyrinomonadaceae bacterium]
MLFVHSQILILLVGLFVSTSSVAPTAQKIADVQPEGCDFTKGYLDHFADELHHQPMSTGYIIYYGGRTYLNFTGAKPRRLPPKHGEAEARVSFWKSYLVTTREIDSARIKVICGGYRQTPIAELWLVPNGAAPPKLSPTLSVRDIKFRHGKLRNRDMFGEDDCHMVAGGATSRCSDAP